jgi:hypothetical protein
MFFDVYGEEYPPSSDSRRAVTFGISERLRESLVEGVGGDLEDPFSEGVARSGDPERLVSSRRRAKSQFQRSKASLFLIFLQRDHAAILDIVMRGLKIHSFLLG